MALRHWIGAAGAVEIIGGAVVNLTPLPKEVSYALILIGIASLLFVILDWVRERQRGLSLRQRDKMASAINENGGIDRWTAIRFAQGCEECRRYAEEFAKAFRLIGWNGEIGVSLDERHDLLGVRIVVKDPAHPSKTATAIAAGMMAAKVNFDWWENIHMADNHTIIWVYPSRR